MYKIIGADQREYGPVTADQVREWIAQGRANSATLVQPEGGTDWVPLSSLSEFSEALMAKAPPAAQPPPPLPPPSDPQALAAHLRTRDYDIDIGQCVSRSWTLLTDNFGLFVGATLIFFVLSAVLGQLLSFFTMPAYRSLMGGNISAGPILLIVLMQVPQAALSTVLTAGFYVLLLKRLRGQTAGIGDLFAGFTGPFMQLAAAGIVIPLLTMVGLALCFLPGIYLSVAWIFAIPLIIDRGLDFWAAMELSRKVLTQHWWLALCLVIIVALINLAGFLVCCVGILAAFPLSLGALMYAYEDIFSGTGSTPGAAL